MVLFLSAELKDGLANDGCVDALAEKIADDIKNDPVVV